MLASPLQRYHASLAQTGFSADPSQANAVNALEGVYQALIIPAPARRFGLGKAKPKAVPGLYFWGGVGRGKTFLMDLFFDALPFAEKRRTHFHRFMLDVHERRRRYPDARDPLVLVAQELAREARVLCFDEFFVSDIADAMILGRLMQVLFEAGVTLVATSNIAPDGLYKDGLQRQNFLPAIAVLKANVTVLNVDGGTDYRLRHLHDADLYLSPCHQPAMQRMQDYFQRFAGSPGTAMAELDLNGRSVTAHRHAPGVAWFEFAELCEGPRGAADYIELARTYRTLLLSGVPVLDRFAENAARRFITLIDEFYDRNVKLIIAADVPVHQLYQGEMLKFEFARTVSRLTEMRTSEYLSQPHRA